MSHRTFRPPRTVREYGYVDGELVVDEKSPSGFLLPWDAIDDQANAATERRPPAYVVIGEFVADDGTRSPELGITTQHIEANTAYRWDRETKTLRLICPACGLKDGKHQKGCDHS